MTDYSAVLSRRHKNREWLLNGDDYEGLVILDGGSKPTQKSLDDAWPDVEAELKAEADERSSARQAAITKLATLGLTDAEVAALLGV